MALLFYDGFDHYNTSQIPAMWTSQLGSPTISSSAGRNSGPCLVTGAPTLIAPKYVSKTLAPGDARCIQGAWMKPAVSLGGRQALLYVGNASGIQCVLILNADYTVALWTSVSGTQIGSNSTVALAGGVGAYVELDVTIGTSAPYDIRVNGVSVLSGTGNTKTQSAATWTVCGPYSQYQFNATGGVVTDYDDYYVCDGTGSAPYNAPLGDVVVSSIYPNSDGANLDWTPSTGTTHYTLVNENPPTDDTGYVYTATVGNRDSYGYQDLPTAGGAILAVAPTLYARKDDAGSRTITDVVRIGSTNYDGASSQSLTTGYVFDQFIHTVDPSTAVAWTVAAVNAAEFGIKLTA